MKCIRMILLAGCLTSISGLGTNAHSQEAGVVPAQPSPAAEKEWYYGPTTPAETKPLGKQRAEYRARQRQARLESSRWYGHSALRPTASGLPFTTMYSPKWTRPGGRPFAWYISQSPNVVISPYYPTYYR